MASNVKMPFADSKDALEQCSGTSDPEGSESGTRRLGAIT